MKHIGIVTSDQIVFKGFISVDLNDNPKNLKYIQMDERLLFHGVEFEMIYFIEHKLPRKSTVNAIKYFIDNRKIPFKVIY